MLDIVGPIVLFAILMTTGWKAGSLLTKMHQTWRESREVFPSGSCLDGRSEEYIRVLAELEREIPTGDEESLAAVAWVANRAQPRVSTVAGSFQTLLAPGLRYSDLQAAGLGSNAQAALGGNPYQAMLGSGLGQGLGAAAPGGLQSLLQQGDLQRLDDQYHKRQLMLQALANAALGGQKH